MTKSDLPVVIKNRPIPLRGYLLAKWQPYLESLEPGDSFDVQDPNAQKAILRAAQRAGIKVTTRKLANGSGWGVWIEKAGERK